MDRSPDAAFIEKIELALDELRPYIHGHGGTVSFVRLEKGIAYVALQGACQVCPFSFITLKMGIEERLREKIPSLKAVELAD